MTIKKKLLKQIATAFEEAYAKHGEPIARSISESDLIPTDLERWGMAIIKDPVSDGSWNNYLQLIACELSEHLFGYDDPFLNEEFNQEFSTVEKKFPNEETETQMLRSFGKWWNSSNGFGNSNFRFLFFQYQDDPPHFQIGKEDIVFSRNPFHRWNIRLLGSEPKLWEILKSFHPKEKAMISWDSAKIRINHPKATKAALTKRHRDVYNYEGHPIDRKQAMLIKQDPGAISLGWVIYSHLPKIQKLLAQYFGKLPDKFSVVEDPELNKIIDKYWRATDGGFVIWEQPTIHYEAQPTASVDYISKFKSFTQPTSTNDLISIRVVIGTHQPHKLDQQELKQLAYLSEKGFCPAIYNNPNKGTAVSVNTVNKKSTQWRKTRTPGTVESTELQNAEDNYKDLHFAIKDIYKEMYGLYQ